MTRTSLYEEVASSLRACLSQSYFVFLCFDLASFSLRCNDHNIELSYILTAETQPWKAKMRASAGLGYIFIFPLAIIVTGMGGGIHGGNLGRPSLRFQRRDSRHSGTKTRRLFLRPVRRYQFGSA
jgi:hypothetical protein